MRTLMIIDTTRLGVFFSITYLGAILVAAGIMIHQGFKKKYPMSTWLLIILSGVLFFIIGTKSATYTPQQWIQVLTRFQFPNANGKTILGGIVGLFTGIFIAKNFLRFKGPVLDTLAVALPVGMAISRIGCLLGGCCFGTPTHLPWGIQYDAASSAYEVHLAEGLIHLHDKSSLAVHPAQLYQVIGCLIIAFVVWRTRKHWKSEGNLFLFSVLCYLVLRFFVEFVRAPETNFFAGHLFMGLKIIQWFILGAILPGLLILFFKEEKAKILILKSLPGRQAGLRLCAFAVKEKENFVKQTYVSDLRQIIFTVLLSIFILAGRKWFDLLELSTIILLFVIVIITFSIKFYQKYSVPGFRWVVPVLLVFSFSFMAQKSIPDRNKGEKITFTEIGITGQVGKYYDELQRVGPFICGHPSFETINRQSVKFYQTGMNVSYNIWQGRYKKYTFGGRLFLGNEVPEQTNISSGEGPVYGITPYTSLDWHWFGLRIGLSVGHMKIPVGMPESALDEGDIISKGYSWTAFSPSLGLRLGPSDILYFESSFPGLFPYMTPYPTFFAGFGTGLGKTDGTKLAFGYCYNNSIYGQMIYPIKNKILLEASYADNLQSGDKSSRIFTIGFRYRFIDEEKDKDKMEVCAISHHVLIADTGQVKKLSKKVEDADGNVYSTFAVGGQVWLDENLKATHYRDGSEISGVTENVPGSGRQYNWFSVNHSESLCPSGWHVPTINEWRSLINSLGSSDVAERKFDNIFNTGGKASQWWSSTAQDTLQAQSIYLNTETIGIMFASAAKTTVLSVRCLKDY
jgi:prolipoprotein diacylglyceryltransferase